MPDQPIALTEYDPSWHGRFLEQQAALSDLLRAWLAGPPEHVGSTAIPSLRAKAIVDIAAPVRSFAAAQDAIPVLQADGWLFWPEDPNRSYRLWFLRPTPEARTHHLQIMQHDHPELHKLLVFRDTLRHDATLRDAYATLKDRLALQFRLDRNAYSDAKSEFVRSVLSAAGVAPSSREPINASAEICRERR